jgi:aconitase A
MQSPGPGRPLAALLVALVTSACTTDGGRPAVAEGTVTFESIDGPPVATADKLVQNLSRAAQARRVAVLSRAAPAQYRIRSYVAARVEGKRTVITWVWDVYDSEQQRVLRLSGEEPGSGNARDWSAADDQVLQRIADRGMEQLVAAVGANAPAGTVGDPGASQVAGPPPGALAMDAPSR